MKNVASASIGELMRFCTSFDPVQVNVPSSARLVSDMVRSRVCTFPSVLGVIVNLLTLPPLQVQVRVGTGIPKPRQVSVPSSLKRLTNSIGVMDTVGGSIVKIGKFMIVIMLVSLT